MATAEPFPILSTSAEAAHNHDGATKRRRKSSALGSELRVGDTGAPGLASSKVALSATEGNGHVSALLDDAGEPSFSTVPSGIWQKNSRAWKEGMGRRHQRKG